MEKMKENNELASLRRRVDRAEKRTRVTMIACAGVVAATLFAVPWATTAKKKESPKFNTVQAERLAIMSDQNATATERLEEIPGIVPPLNNLPPGCAFAPRCRFADEQCTTAYPPYEEKRPGHWAACWHSERLFGGGGNG